MTHLWVRAEERANEARVGITPEGVRALREDGFEVTVEASEARAIGIDGYASTGANLAAAGAWRTAPSDAIIFGLKELPEDEHPLPHQHIMFGHAFKGQPAGQRLLDRFEAGGGRLYDLEYLVDEEGRRVAAFGYWAGYAGAAATILGWAAQELGRTMAPVRPFDSSGELLAYTQSELAPLTGLRPNALVIGALGRVGRGVIDFCEAMGVAVTAWDMAETAHGGPFPEVLSHDLFFNCILARPGTPVFVSEVAPGLPRALRVIGDIACDPDSDFSPVRVYDRVTDWAEPVLRVHETPPLDVMAIDNLPAMLPVESSEDFASQLLPSLRTLGDLNAGVWGRAAETYDSYIKNR